MTRKGCSRSRFRLHFITFPRLGAQPSKLIMIKSTLDRSFKSEIYAIFEGIKTKAYYAGHKEICESNGLFTGTIISLSHQMFVCAYFVSSHQICNDILMDQYLWNCICIRTLNPQFRMTNI